MPAAVPVGVARVPQVVLLAQFVGDAGRRGAKTCGSADDLGSAAGVVGDLTQGVRIHSIARRGAAPPATAAIAPATRRKAGGLTSAAREGPRYGKGNLYRGPDDVVAAAAGAVDPERVDEHVALANLLSQGTHRR